jgi:hypothetical protein
MTFLLEHPAHQHTLFMCMLCLSAHPPLLFETGVGNIFALDVRPSCIVGLGSTSPWSKAKRLPVLLGGSPASLASAPSSEQAEETSCLVGVHVSLLYPGPRSPSLCLVLTHPRPAHTQPETRPAPLVGGDTLGSSSVTQSCLLPTCTAVSPAFFAASLLT